MELVGNCFSINGENRNSIRKNNFLMLSIICLTLVLLFLSCNDSDHEFNLDDLPEHKELQIPTYDGSFQAMHPDVIFFENGIDGHYFLMAFTPYPSGLNQYENPSVVVSDNGTDFYEESEGINPIAVTPSNGYNNDPDILYDPGTHSFFLYYNETFRPDSQNIVIVTSKNRIQWERKSVVHYNFKKGQPFVLSPACVYSDSGYYLFYVNASVRFRPIQYLVSDNGLDWNLEDIHSIEYSFPSNLMPWHIDVFGENNNYYMLVCAPYPNTDLYLARSSDLFKWEFHQKPIIDHNTTFFGPCDRVYRSSGIVRDDLLVVWFSYRRLDGTWGTAIQKFSLSLLFK